MFEYQIYVAPLGYGAPFETEWMSDKARAYAIAMFLYEKFGHETVSVRRRDMLMQAAKGIEAIEDLFI